MSRSGSAGRGLPDPASRISRGRGAGLAVLLFTAFVVVGDVGAAAASAATAPSPPAAYVQKAACVSQGVPPTTVQNGVSWAQRLLLYTEAWRFTRGGGVKVAVIDTGVNPGPAFGDRLSGLADLVATGGTAGTAGTAGTGGTGGTASAPGLDDCDGHGTLVAGLIAGSPDPKSGFSGVAPDATLLSIRQSSERYALRDDTNSSDAPGAGTPASLGSAIRYAVAHGAQVINISEADCGPAGTVDSPELSSAVQAAVAANVVIVVSAGNLDSSADCSHQNTPGKPAVTAATPADLPGVLAVGAIAQDGSAAAFSIAGPWVGIAGPGTEITSTNPFRGGAGQVDQITTQAGTGSIQGTSFSAPYVAGVAALVRARFPDLTAAQVIHRLEATASHPAAPRGRNDAVGYGMVNPVAAVTAVLPEEAGVVAPPSRATSLPARATPEQSDHARQTALWGSLITLTALVALAVVAQTRRSRLRRAATHDRAANPSPARS
ncbi:membrane-anchored mycosin MYCP [Jatrophihabitans sp. GAS493]|uniref:type VII secretion-associated serine protease mycosin n=1 Tax=Jatrophihabitans sp. GAS493 TaxID=1907575 RepID=UPI000BB6FFBE|nr:type VII secretion-associated serine protease mycosin [Jatrophihabitans sp. GAS493]SOD72415.1 membrane-anchored mycosin MYCP [Jatrophihabitans sp. GAS493]